MGSSWVTPSVNDLEPPGGERVGEEEVAHPAQFEDQGLRGEWDIGSLGPTA